MYADDRCYNCGIPIPPRPGYVPGCADCLMESHRRYLALVAADKRLSAMGAKPGKKTLRAARLRAIREMGVKDANDNGVRFGTERR